MRAGKVCVLACGLVLWLLCTACSGARAVRGLTVLTIDTAERRTTRTI